MEAKKHWRDIYESEFLASWDLEKNVVLTISEAKEEICKLAKGKEKKLLLRFVEKELPNGVTAKPMICIPTNCKAIQSVTGTGEFSNWKGIRIEVGIGENKGGIGNSVGLRIVNVFGEVDIQHILKSKDLAFVRAEANTMLRGMSSDQKAQVRDHIAQLESGSDVQG